MSEWALSSGAAGLASGWTGRDIRRKVAGVQGPVLGAQVSLASACDPTGGAAGWPWGFCSEECNPRLQGWGTQVTLPLLIYHSLKDLDGTEATSGLRWVLHGHVTRWPFSLWPVCRDSAKSITQSQHPNLSENTSALCSSPRSQQRSWNLDRNWAFRMKSLESGLNPGLRDVP